MPSGLVFAVQGPRFITHMRRLHDIRVPLANFFASGVLALREKLGPVLWQLPSTLAWDKHLFEAFLLQLPHDSRQAAERAREHDAHVAQPGIPSIVRNHRVRHAIEVRHDGFRDPRFITQLRRHGVALMVADSAGRWPRI